MTAENGFSTATTYITMQTGTPIMPLLMKTKNKMPPATVTKFRLLQCFVNTQVAGVGREAHSYTALPLQLT